MLQAPGTGSKLGKQNLPLSLSSHIFMRHVWAKDVTKARRMSCHAQSNLVLTHGLHELPQFKTTISLELLHCIAVEESGFVATVFMNRPRN